MSEKALVATFTSEHEQEGGGYRIIRTTEFSLDGRQLVMKGNIIEQGVDDQGRELEAYHELPDVRLSDYQQLRNLKSLLDRVFGGGTVSG